MQIDNSHYATSAQRRSVSNIMSIMSEDLSRANRILLVAEELNTLAPLAAMSLSIYDPLTRNHNSIFSHGYSRETVAYLDNSYMSIDPAYLWILRTNQSFFSWETTNFDYSRSISARNFWNPAGYKGGSTSYLKSRSNRYVGNLHTSSEDPGQPSVGFLRIIDDISPVLSALVDNWETPKSLIEGLEEHACSLFIDDKGNTQRPHRHEACIFGRIHELSNIAARKYGNIDSLHVIGARLPSTCWCLCGEIVHRVDFKICHGGWLVSHVPASLPFGLTIRQAEVCSLSAIGMTRTQIADILTISARTVDRHIENILEKTFARNRIELAYLAASSGLINLDYLVAHFNSAQCHKKGGEDD
ncbi:helix-turn-helix transcriptional regulator [Paracoccus sp. DMF]|uniref:helix-turn-helix transcriptional regulator n=1 Tax=Paracoccus sp. DMF TaxID=400837 RepID=UPI0011030A63|nr:helix-turn-helix transcriptional regulator [Paracoccus sp. DMF]